MEKRNAVRLNGWQRLWIAAAVLFLIPAAATIVAGWDSAGAWVRDLEVAAPTRVAVEGVGEVEFPATMSPEAIAIVTRAGKGSAEAIRAGVRAWDVEFRRALDTQAAALNRLLVLRVLGYWVAGIVGLYLIGWLASWVRRGFGN